MTNEEEIEQIICKHYPAQSYKRMRSLANECYQLGLQQSESER